MPSWYKPERRRVIRRGRGTRRRSSEKYVCIGKKEKSQRKKKAT
jgi:hypothetical protein